jgi:NAD(P)-dependent dehydrogenase (short-subunit alcohol dehydrogenase family)
MSQPAQQQDPPGTERQMRPAPDHGEASYRGSGRLAGKAAVVTGADSGIGKAVAIAFAREGADVVISYLDEHEDAEDTRKWVEDAGRAAVLVPGDLTDAASCRAVIDRAVQEFGRVDILVSNAAFQATHQELTEISGTTSVNSDMPSPQLLPYDVTKAGVANFMAGLAQMLAEKGIRANSVAPGPIWTPLIPATMPAEQVESFGQQVPLSRAGQPAEVAPAYVFLASDEASYVSGARIAVTGGNPIL